MIAFTIFVFFKVPETKNKTFEEIASQFQKGTDIEVEEVVDYDDDDDVFHEMTAAPKSSTAAPKSSKVVTKSSATPNDNPESARLMSHQKMSNNDSGQTDETGNVAKLNHQPQFFLSK